MNFQDMDPEMQALMKQFLAQAMQQRGPSPQDGMQMRVDAAGSLGPEGFAEHIASNTFGKRAALGRDMYGQEADAAAGDLAQAQKLQAQRFGNSGSATGNVLGGLGDVLNSLRGGIMENRARGERSAALDRLQKGQTGFLDREDATNSAYAQAQLEAMKKYLAQQQAQGGGMQAPAAGGGFGFGLPQLKFGG